MPYRRLSPHAAFDPNNALRCTNPAKPAKSAKPATGRRIAFVSGRTVLRGHHKSDERFNSSGRRQNRQDCEHGRGAIIARLVPA